MFMPVKDKAGTHKFIRTVTLDKAKLDAIAELLGIPAEERAKLKPGKLHLVLEAETKSKKKKSKK